mgnify:CR=1 FL=1
MSETTNQDEDARIHDLLSIIYWSEPTDSLKTIKYCDCIRRGEKNARRTVKPSIMKIPSFTSVISSTRWDRSSLEVNRQLMHNRSIATRAPPAFSIIDIYQRALVPFLLIISYSSPGYHLQGNGAAERSHYHESRTLVTSDILISVKKRTATTMNRI